MELSATSVVLAGATPLLLALTCAAWSQVQEWAIHDEKRPAPKVVEPGTAASLDAAGRPPSDAIVLFDGKDLSQWRAEKDGGPAAWKVEGGYMEVVAGRGNIRTALSFGDCQLHLEWAAPAPPAGTGQDRGNSGVFLMGQYEVQVLDSYQTPTYPDGQAAALYGQYPPLVNASRPPGEWQSYDIVFRAPRFGKDGALLRPARITVLHNGVLVHDGRELTGPTAHKARPAYKAHPGKLPLGLQDHAHPVRFRNIWVRELSGED
jgi:hypothetical protein